MPESVLRNFGGAHLLLGPSPGPKTASTVLPLSVSTFSESRQAEHPKPSMKKGL